MKITAVIPVRAGSTRVKDKNIRPFAGSSLLEIKIEQLKKVKEVSQIIVSSDSEEMLQAAKRAGVVAKRRPDEYCDEKTKTFNEVVRYIADYEVETEIMMWAPCVCPLIDSPKIAEGIKMFENTVMKEKRRDSVATACLFKEYILSEDGPCNFSIEHFVKTQDLPEWHYITNGFYIAKREDMSKWGFVYGPNPYLCEVSKSEAIDIDDEYDFAVAEYIYNRTKCAAREEPPLRDVRTNAQTGGLR